MIIVLIIVIIVICDSAPNKSYNYFQIIVPTVFVVIVVYTAFKSPRCRCPVRRPACVLPRVRAQAAFPRSVWRIVAFYFSHTDSVGFVEQSKKRSKKKSKKKLHI